jgi:hypothetical protein
MYKATALCDTGRLEEADVWQSCLRSGYETELVFVEGGTLSSFDIARRSALLALRTAAVAEPTRSHFVAIGPLS